MKLGKGFFDFVAFDGPDVPHAAQVESRGVTHRVILVADVLQIFGVRDHEPAVRKFDHQRQVLALCRLNGGLNLIRLSDRWLRVR